MEVITSPAGGVGAARCKLPDTAALGGWGLPFCSHEAFHGRLITKGGAAIQVHGAV